jgi:anthranilate synthase component 1
VNGRTNIAVRRLNVYRDLLPLHAQNTDRFPFLLESVAHGTQQGRFDVLFAFPEESLWLDHDGGVHGWCEGEGGDFLANLDRWWEQERVESPATELPFWGGWFLYLGYELAAQVEPSLKLPRSQDDIPMAFATRCPAAVIRDHEARCTWLVAEEKEAELLEVLEADVRRSGASCTGARVRGKVTREAPAEEYGKSVRRILDYIAAGDVFQVNICRGWEGQLDDGVTHVDVYAALRCQNPAPFAGLVRWEGSSIISSSPERLLQVRNGMAQTRPIAGTRPRDPQADRDRAFSRELMGHPKERAEHIMLIDLERNDLGRVCEPGSVEVNELMVLESYAHVHHIVSNVRGRLRHDVTPGAAIRAVFPGGTITGCPKVRCMEIIAELEGTGRGPYTGSMGYLNRDGSLDLNILIRTLLTEGRRLSLRAGAGIVADSNAEHELMETRAKARGMLLALEGEVV